MIYNYTVRISIQKQPQTATFRINNHSQHRLLHRYNTDNTWQ